MSSLVISLFLQVPARTSLHPVTIKVLTMAESHVSNLDSPIYPPRVAWICSCIGTLHAGSCKRPMPALTSFFLRLPVFVAVYRLDVIRAAMKTTSLVKVFVETS